MLRAGQFIVNLLICTTTQINARAGQFIVNLLICTRTQINASVLGLLEAFDIVTCFPRFS